MGTYITKQGENIYDVSMKLYGGLEGLVDLLVSNQDALTHNGLSIFDKLPSGTVLNYTKDYYVHRDIVDWLSKNDIIVRNGDHAIPYLYPQKYAKDFITTYNKKVIEKAARAWPIALSETPTEESIVAFLNYVNSYIMLIDQLVESDLSNGLNDLMTRVSEITIPDKPMLPFMVINHIGTMTSISFNLQINETNSYIIIDWGDNSLPYAYATKGVDVIAEHCYEDTCNHIIRIYGDGKFESLDLREINGIYYITYPIHVISGNFYTNASNEMNELILLD